MFCVPGCKLQKTSFYVLLSCMRPNKGPIRISAGITWARRRMNEKKAKEKTVAVATSSFQFQRQW